MVGIISQERITHIKVCLFDIVHLTGDGSKAIPKTSIIGCAIPALGHTSSTLFGRDGEVPYGRNYTICLVTPLVDDVIPH